MNTVRRLLLYPALFATVASIMAAGAMAQAPAVPTDLRGLMRGICHEQIQMLQRHDTRLRYQVRRVDRKGETLRDQIESHDGGVARLLQHNGQALTPDEAEGDRKRLEAMLGGEKLRTREREEARGRSNGAELLQTMPDAMLFTLAPDQPQLSDVQAHQWVLDFAPDPNFHPASMAQQILPALRGRLWINSQDRQLLRMQLQNTADVNLAWGLLAKVYSGGSVTYDQRRFQDIYTFTHIVLHMRVRELMLKTVQTDTDTTASGFRRLPSSPSGDEAIRMLLAETVPTR